MALRSGPARRFGPALAIMALAVVFSACAPRPETEQARRWQAATPGLERIYRDALAELGPHKYTGIHIPAVVLDHPPGPVIKPARLLPDDLGPKAPPASWHAVAWTRAGDVSPVAGPAPVPMTAPAPVIAKATPAPPPSRPATEAAADETKGAVSELRFGALKHAIAFNHTAKEGGVDGNAEMLFHSPAFLSLLLSPRPMVGLTINGNEADTDFLYGGLYWEWAPVDWFFAGFSFGLSVHDGMLDNSQIAGKARSDRREFGCRALFRESVELGARFAGRHSLSVMWAHHSHGSLCHEENEGIDNAGLRYGIRL